MFLMESPRLNLGCHFDNQLYLIPGTAQDDVDDRVDVGDVDFAITVHVGSSVIISAQNHVFDALPSSISGTKLRPTSTVLHGLSH